MSLRDSLDTGIDQYEEGTYRVDIPFPRTIENEEEFITNSGRRVKNFSPLSKQQQDSRNPYDQQRLKYLSDAKRNPTAEEQSDGITDSLQAELHLSLDRLSNTSYDQEDLDRIKTKNDGQKSSLKTYPIIQKMQEGANFNSTVVISSPRTYAMDKITERTQEDFQPSQYPSSVVSQTSSNDSLNPSKLVEESDDDIRTVVVEDSLSLAEQEAALHSYDLVTSHTSSADRSIAEQDQYSHLRYNPEWRNNEHNALISAENRSLPSNTNVDREEEEERSSSTDAYPSPGGAITIHNKDFSPHKFSELMAEGGPAGYDTVKDSPVRLSSDPTRLLQMNKKYEDEFNRMLELEREWSTVTEENEFSEEHPANSQNKQTFTPNPRSKLKPPTSYRKKPVTANSELSPYTSDSQPHNYNIPNPHTHQVQAVPQRFQNTSAPKTSTTTPSKEKKSFAPTPPRVPRSRKDYVELNKARLGRKSNSASYLEMYAKKNKQFEEALSPPRRPKSDSNKKLKAREQQQDYESPRDFNENNLNLSLEDQWKLQAERLKIAKDGNTPTNAKPSRRRALREVGVNTASKPMYSPAQMAGTAFNEKNYTPLNTSDNSRMEDYSKHNMSLASPRRNNLASAESDYSEHPAFATFSSRNSHRSDNMDFHHSLNRRHPSHVVSVDQYYPSEYNDSFSSYTNPQSRDPSSQQYHMNQNSDLFQSSFNPLLRGKDGTDQHHMSQHAHKDREQQYHAGYHKVTFDDMQHIQPSPLMQAYQHRFVPAQKPMDSHQRMNLPPSHPSHMSPEREAEEAYYRERHAEESSHQFSKYKVALPPTPPAHRRSKDRRSSSTSPPLSDKQFAEIYSKSSEQLSPINRMKSVPRLPPILGSNTSPRHIDSSNDSGIVGSTPRYSLSDSETAVPGGYLQRHEKSKRKPTYKKYTLEDYKSLKRDINLGGLGPDLLTAKIKMGKVERARKYAEFIRQQHKSSAANTQNKSPASEGEEISGMADYSLLYEPRQRFTLGKDSGKKKMEMQEKRRRALEYARQVPRPKVISTDLQDDNTSSERHHNDESLDQEKSGDMLDWDLLKNLRDRHEREKAVVAQMTSPNKVT